MRIDHPMCLDFVKRNWNINIFGFPILFFMKKLKNLKGSLKTWNNVTFGNVHHVVKRVKDGLEKVQMRIQDEDYS